MFGAKAHFYASQHAIKGEASYLYYFNKTSPLERQTAGAFHSAEIPYVFGSDIAILPMDDQGSELSTQMSRYWRNFARSGDPSDNELPRWQSVEGEANHWMILGKRVGIEAIEKEEKYEILNRRLQRELAELARV
jgi:carboxylesterase type B